MTQAPIHQGGPAARSGGDDGLMPGKSAGVHLRSGWQARSFLAGALLASPADLLADGLTPSWPIRVGACLAGRFPRRNLRLCLGRRALLLKKFGRRLLVILLKPAVKETHGVIVDG